MRYFARGLMLALAIALVATLARGQVPTVWPAPQGAQTIPLEVSSTGTTGAITATLAAASGKTTYICGMVVTSGGTTAATSGDLTVTGLTNTLHFLYVFVSSGQGLLGWAVPNCLPASATNTAIVVNVPAGGAGTTVAVSAWGYQN